MPPRSRGRWRISPALGHAWRPGGGADRRSKGAGARGRPGRRVDRRLPERPWPGCCRCTPVSWARPAGGCGTASSVPRARAGTRSAPACCSPSASWSPGPAASGRLSLWRAAASTPPSRPTRAPNARCCCSPRGWPRRISAPRTPRGPRRGEGLAIAERAEHRFAEAQNRWVLGFLELSARAPGRGLDCPQPVVAMLRTPGGRRARRRPHPSRRDRGAARCSAGSMRRAR